ncbi:general substrate transporter [Radiomyces spectabilis]|uniref:general substrate transporter n=1 Tax=Radiomyces spectabilis TaxID=64574 RepID=UPI00221E8A26|nr:general substrate transporter [Radiomyces spectabilis]KAI8393991.1 general substrate transporter [Radiomyces spectabilis]
MRHITLGTEAKTWIICSFLALGGFIFGYNFGILSGLLVTSSIHKDLDDPGTDEGPRSTLVNVTNLGAFVGALISGPLADLLGRKGLVSLAAVIFMFGDVLQVGASDLNRLYGGRVVTGLAVGILSMAVPLYQSELAPKEMRGRMISIQQFAITLGICISFWIAYGVSSDVEGLTWRLGFGIQLIPTLILLLGMIAMPQSPRFSVSKNKPKEALETLARLRGDGSTDHPDVLMEYAEICQNNKFERRLYGHMSAYRRLFAAGPENNRRRLLLGISIQIFQQLTGINVILTYAPNIFRMTGLTSHNVLFANGISGIVNMMATIPAVILIDKLGRRPTTIGGAVVCCISLCVMAIISGLHSLAGKSMDDPNSGGPSLSPDDNAALVPIWNTDASAIGFMVMMYIFVASFACTWGPAGWIYPTELYSQGVRAKALSITTAANWLFNFVILQIAPVMLNRIYWRTYVVFAVFCVLIAIAIYAFFPETTGKSLEEVDLIFSCEFNYYDLAVHHPQTAAAALNRLERTQQQNHRLSIDIPATTSLQTNPVNLALPDNA